MPTYDYRCRACDHVTSRVFTMAETPKTIECEECAKEASKIISQVSVKLSNMSKMARLDPKYDKMVDRAMGSTTSADPDNYLKRMKPFSGAKE